MPNVTKKDLIDRIVEETGVKRVLVRQIIQQFLDSVTDELGEGHRIELRDFGVFEVRQRAARLAQNPKTLEKVHVPPKRSVRFKAGRMMKLRVEEADASRRSRSVLVSPKVDDQDGLPIVEVTDQIRSSSGSGA